jgi:Flp pilus assembly protein CpaB
MKIIKKNMWMLLAVALMGACVYGFYLYVSTIEISQTTVQTLKPVRTLQSGEIIDPKLLKVAIVSTKEHRKDAILDVNQLAGKVVVVPIGIDEEIVPWKIASIRTQPAQDERYFSFKTDSVTNVNDLVRKGDRVDVWVEFDKPRLVRYLDKLQYIGAVKIIENLPVVAVKNADGLEISDVEGNRNKPDGKPDANTYLMTDDVYNAYTIAQMTGKIKLALPNMTLAIQPDKKGAVTPTFMTLKDAGFFMKNNVDAKGEINATEVRTASPQSPPATPSPQSPNAEPNPQSPNSSIPTSPVQGG